MIRFGHLNPKFVDDMPEQLEPGFLYVSMRYATAMHLCCCGCGSEVVTPLSPAQWKLTFDGEAVSLHPSIGSWALRCRSHYVINGGRVIEAPSWSDEAADYGRARDRRARDAYYEKPAEPADAVMRETPKRKGWLERIGDLLTGKS